MRQQIQEKHNVIFLRILILVPPQKKILSIFEGKLKQLSSFNYYQLIICRINVNLKDLVYKINI